MKNIFKIVPFLMAGVLMSQTIEIGNTTMNTGGSGVTGTLTTNETYRFQHTVSIGEPFIGTVDLGADGAMSLGQFSFYNQRTDEPTVTASEGDYPDQVKVNWSIDVLQPPIQNGVNIYRNGELKAQFGYGISEWVDENVFPGEVYIYEVQAENHYGLGITGEADGFVNPNGRITGKIQTNHQTPVYGVEVALDPYFGKTLEFDGENDFIEIVDFPNDIFTDNTYTIEFWMNVQTHQYGLPIAKWNVQGANDNAFLINDHGDFLSAGGVTTSLPTAPTVNEWHHLSYVVNNGNLSVYLDSVIVATGSGHHSDITDYPIMIGDYWNGGYPFDGHLDEIRIWNTARDSAQIIDNMHRVVDSDDIGLAAEWRFDEGIGSKVFDITDASHDGHITGAIWSDENPDIHNSAFTDMDGNYSIRGIYYEPSGTEFTVTPYKMWHEFTPENKTVTLSTSSTASDGVDFVDNSQIAVSGYINFFGTSCYENGVEIKEEIENEDGSLDTVSLSPPILTDNEGHYVCEFEPGTSHKLIPQFGEHLFTPTSYETGVITMPQANKNFTDGQTYTLTGSVTGGDCALPLGEVFQVIISTQPSCYDDTVLTYGNGNYAFHNLPARHYEVSVYSENPYFDFTGQEANLTCGNDTVNFVWREPLQLEITGLPSNECDMTILQQIQSKEITLNAFEEYNGSRCYVNNVLFTIDDEISDLTDQVQFVFSDSLFNASSPDSFPNYTILPGYPNFLSGGDYPYQKSLTITVEDLEGREAIQTKHAYVEGHKPREATFTSRLPEYPMFILRDPPGDNSYVEIERDSSISTEFKLDIMKNDGSDYVKWDGSSWGVKKSINIGKFVTVSTFVQDIYTSNNVTDVSYQTRTGNEGILTLTFKETFRTSDSEDVTGEGGDVFIGGAMNIIHAKTDILEVGSENDACAVVMDSSFAIAPDDYETFYIYTQSHIKNTLIPQLYEVLNDTASALMWENILTSNDSLKSISTLIQNVSFDGGAGAYDHTETVTRDTSWSTEALFDSTHHDVDDTDVWMIAYGEQWGEDKRYRMHRGQFHGTNISNTSTVKYVLDDDDVGDYFSVDVKEDGVQLSPVFDLVAGASKCPWEEGSQQRQQVQLQMDEYSAVNILQNEDAVFSLYAGNTSETDEEWEYHLRLINISNPDGAIIKIGGQPLGSAVFPYTIPAGQQQTLSLTVERGPTEYVYDNIELMLYSPCEYELWEQTGIRMDPALADTVAFSVHFIEPCGGVPEIAYPSDGWVGNSSDSTVFFTINGYNRFDQALSHILMEYQHNADGVLNNSGNNGDIALPTMNAKMMSGNTMNTSQNALTMTLDGWFIADTIFVDSLNADYYNWQWDVSFMDDGHYEVRAVGECIDGELNASTPVAGQLDREPPEVFGEMHPTDGVLNADDEIRIVFEEAIDCEHLFPDQVHLYNESFGMDVAIDFDCFENEIIVVPDVQNVFIENCYLKLTIDELWDLQMNHTESPIVFEFFVDQNPIHWNQNIIEDVVFMGEDKTITTTLHNPGTAGSPFVFSGQPWFLDQQTTPLPWWIDVDPTQGDLNPGGEYPVEMTISGMLNLGEHEETFYAHTTDGDEPLTISVRSLCPPPVWELDEQAYQFSMNLSCQISVQNEISTDEYDFVAAFVDDECRGYSPIEHQLILSEPYDSTWTENGIEHTHTFVDTLMDKHIGFMTIHSDVQSGELLTFRLWDASDCEEYYEIEQHFDFVANSVLGNPEVPVVLNATGAVAQFVTMEAGWTWFSVHLNHEDDLLNINNIFSHEEHFTNGERIIHQSEFETYSESAGEWMPGTMQLDPREMYMAHLDTQTPVTFIGHEINPDSLELTLYPDWNWLGYPLRFNHSVNEALQNLSPTNESVIKSETQFAEYVESIGLWVGSLQWMTPGHGYLYKSTSDDALTFTYSGLTSEQGGGLARMIADERTDAIESPWTLNAKKFRYNMPVVCEIENGEWDVENIVVSAMVSDEVRGIAQPIYEPVIDEWRIYLMVHSNQSTGEAVKFNIYDTETGTEYFTKEITTFDSNGKAGSVAYPILLSKATAVIPDEFVLSQNYPNPFNPTTTIQFGVPKESNVELHIYDLLGREIVTLVNGHLDAGYHSVVWNGRDSFGKSVSSGMYFTVMQSENFRAVKKMVMLK